MSEKIMSPATRAIPILPRRMFSKRYTHTSSPLTFYMGCAIAVFIAVVALFSPWMGLRDPASTELTARLLAPGTDGHILGTDQLGRDILARTVAGARWSLGIGLTAMTIGVAIGTTLGVGAAWATKFVSVALSRVIDVGLSFPYLVIAITIIAVAGKSFWALALTLGLVCWPPVARVLYAEAIGLREREYIIAARLLGVRPGRVVFAHVLPALRPTMQVMAAFIFAEMMIAESGMSFLGLGAPLGDPTWGNALSESRSYMAAAPWMMLIPAAAIVVSVVAANFIGDGLTTRSKQRRMRINS